jgi:hypothetical protein
MSDNNKSWSANVDPYFIFCIAFAIVGVWFPDHIMWVVWVFVGYVALMVIVAVIALIVAGVALYKASKWF